MFKVKVKNEILQHCQNQINYYNFGQRSVANGNREQQLTGIIGQCVVMEMFEQGYIDGSTGCDDGTDISVLGCSVDVKTMGRTTDVRSNYVNNFIALQLKFSTDIFIFCSYHKLKQEITVCGWIPKAEFLQKASFFPKGSTRTRFDGSTFQTFADLYEIRNDLLNDVNSPDTLRQQIEQWCRNKNAASRPSSPVAPRPVTPIQPRPSSPVAPRPVTPTPPRPSSPVTPRPVAPKNDPVVPKQSSNTGYTPSNNNSDSEFGCAIMAGFAFFFGILGGAGSTSWGGALVGAIIGVVISLFVINRNK